jgi:hypothetical protein
MPNSSPSKPSAIDGVFFGGFDKKGESGWKNFYRKYPGATGLVTFSRVGFNRKMDEALAHLTAQSGLGSGAGFFAYLRKRKGVWRFISTLTISQS